MNEAPTEPSFSTGVVEINELTQALFIYGIPLSSSSIEFLILLPIIV